MGSSHLKDFLLISVDYLKLMAYKAKSTDKREYEVLEGFYDACKSIIEKAELDLHGAHIQGINEHIKAVILQAELKQVYNDLFKKYPGFAADLISKSAIPTKKELESNVAVK